MKAFNCKTILRGANQGYSLIEVLVSMAIFSIGILAVGTMALSTTRNTTNGNIMTQATMLARAKIEEKKREADAGVPLTCDAQDGVDMYGDEDPGGIYNLEYPFCTGNKIQVTVKWERRGPRSVTLTTLY